jgi:hypothetical protein
LSSTPPSTNHVHDGGNLASSYCGKKRRASSSKSTGRLSPSQFSSDSKLTGGNAPGMHDVVRAANVSAPFEFGAKSSLWSSPPYRNVSTWRWRVS